MILADTSALIALIDADDRHHGALRDLFERAPDEWILPWSVLPEVDYLLGTRVGRRAQQAFILDLATGAFSLEWGDPADLVRANELCLRYADLGIGLVDATVIGIAERLEVAAIATLDLRHFGTIRIEGEPRLYPRDL